MSDLSFLKDLEKTIKSRHHDMPEKSYTTQLFKAGRARMLQKIGEEAVETVIAGMAQDHAGVKFEAADLIFHLMVYLESEGLALGDVVAVLKERHAK